MGYRGTIFLILISLNASKAFGVLAVSCKDPKNCHPSVAALEIEMSPAEVKYTGVKYDHCTGFLIAKDKILTNSHCAYARILPILRVGKSCNGISIKFPKTAGYEAESPKCFRVDAFGDWNPGQNPDAPDYMILQLASPVKRPVLKINKEAVEDLAVHKNYAFDFEVQRADVTLAVQRVEPLCTLDMKNELKPFGGLSNLLFYKDCNIQLGNSGSVMIDSKGQATALVMAKVTSSGQGTYDEDIFSPAGTAFNLACLDTILGTEKDIKTAEKCDMGKSGLALSAFAKKQYEDILQRRDKTLNTANKQAVAVKQYESVIKIKYTPEGQYDQLHGNFYETVYPRFECVVKAGVQRFPEFHMQLSSFGVHAAFNKDYRLEYLGEKESVMKTFFQVKSISDKQVEAIITVTTDGIKDRPVKMSFPVCQ